ncbi:MAG: hypothetical protein CVV05_04495 [Gammaproteobacteria bacterium HGW-Gammaproteobacteria-1]|jgi:hypothetical protein|nr:MAG: hypothetical protein CVV05_04495 [Gammaproteobacteria bacterium HGW-Gammaproteobacteria-1]
MPGMISRIMPRGDSITRSELAKVSALVFLCVALMAVLWNGLYPYMIVDDAYIHFRIAEQYASTGQPYFNTGEAVMATSSPLWTVLLTLLAFLPGEMAFKVFALVEVPVLAGVVVLSFLAFRAFGVAANWALGYAAGVFILLYGVSLNLMETPLAVLMVLLALLAFVARHPVWPVFAVVASFIRYEMSVVFLALAAYQVFVLRDALKPALFALITGGVVVVWLYATFGTVIPNAIGIKSVVYDVPWDAFINSTLPGGRRTLRLFLLLVLALLGYLFFRARRRNSIRGTAMPLVLLMAGALIFSVYAFRRAFLHEWYVPNYTVLVFMGGAALYWACANAYEGRNAVRILASLVPLLFIAPYAALVMSDVNAAVVDLGSYRSLEAGGRVERYAEIGRKLYHENPRGILLTSEIGGLGYGYRGHIADGVGLATPGARKYHPLKVPEQRQNGMIGAIPPAYVKDTMPDFIVSYPIFSKALLDDAVLQQYRCDVEPPLSARVIAAKPAAGVWGDDRILVCRKLAAAK